MQRDSLVRHLISPRWLAEMHVSLSLLWCAISNCLLAEAVTAGLQLHNKLLSSTCHRDGYQYTSGSKLSEGPCQGNSLCMPTAIQSLVPTYQW